MFWDALISNSNLSPLSLACKNEGTFVVSPARNSTSSPHKLLSGSFRQLPIYSR